ncbi:hypothetical protein HRG_014424 [Hirsutella rhossiliensis]
MMNPQNQAGATLADAIHDTFPNIAAALHRVQACDCSSLASMLQDPTDDMYKNQSFFVTDFIRIQHIAGLLGGSASKLYRKKFDFIIEHEENQAIWPWQTHTDCLAEMNKQYETLDLTLSASQAFDNLWMGKKPFQNFIADFAALAEVWKD